MPSLGAQGGPAAGAEDQPVPPSPSADSAVSGSPYRSPAMFFRDVKALVFDFDGTLADSSHIWGEVNTQFFRKRGIPDDPSLDDEIAGFNVNESAVYMKKKYGLAESPEDLLEEWKAIYLELYATNLDYIRGAVDFIQIMRRRGLKVGIATAADTQTLDAYFGSHADTRGLFDAIVTTTDVGKPKPDPAVYLECMSRLGGTPGTTVVFEDTVTGLQGARATGSRVVCIRSSDSNLQQKVELSDWVVADYVPLVQSVSLEEAA